MSTRERLLNGVAVGGRPVGVNRRRSLADVAPQGFGSRVYDAVADQPVWQMFNAINFGSSNYEEDPDYDPLADGEIDGWVSHAGTLVYARSKAHADAMKAQIREDEERKFRRSANASILSDLAALFLVIYPSIILVLPFWAIAGFFRTPRGPSYK